MENSNVVVVVIDALREDRIWEERGSERIMPNFANLMKESTYFSNSFSVSNATDPAITSLQTGCYPLSHGIVNHGFRVEDEEKRKIENVKQLPEVLSEKGYSTAKFGRPLGRWHRKGFDIYPSVQEDRAAFDQDSSNLQIKSLVYDSLSLINSNLADNVSSVYNRSIGRFEKEKDDKEVSNQDKVLENFKEFINGSEDPFYAFVHLMDTHEPYRGDPQIISKYLNEHNYEVDIGLDAGEKAPQTFYDWIVGEEKDILEKYYYSDREPSTAVVDAHYDAAANKADARLGEILDNLKQNNLLSETLLVVLADHGESLTEHGIYYDHHGLYDVSVNIPLLFRVPNQDSEEKEELVQITDVAPTLVDYLDVGEDIFQTDGFSLKPIIENQKSSVRDFVMAEEAHTSRRRMIRDKAKKLIYSLDGKTVCRYCDVQHAPELEFYDLIEDEKERENLGKSNGSEKLKKRAESRAKEFSDGSYDTEDGEISYEDEEEIHERLEELGYK